VTERVLVVSTWWKNGRIFKLLLAHGTAVDVANDGEKNWEQRGETALHDAAGAGYVEPIQLLLARGAAASARDGFGRTPLMHLAAAMPWLDRGRRIAEERAKRVPTEAQKELRAKIASQTKRRGDRETADGMAAARLLLAHGADARLKDQLGNDALMVYEWERRREREECNEEFAKLLRDARAARGEATMALFDAVRADDLAAAQRAIKAGADVNHEGPPPVGFTPLVVMQSAAMMQLLLESGADANRATARTTPLIAAARGGELEMVKILVEAGADIHAIEPRSPKSEYLENAYSAAEMNGKKEVAAYLKKLGTGKPVLKEWEPLEAGVHMWENFSEIMVKEEVRAVAAAVAKVIGGRAEEGVYGREVWPGKRSYLVIRPKGMTWCNVLRLTPARRLLDDFGPFIAEVAKAAGTAALLLDYSDTSDAGEIRRFEADGSAARDRMWERETLEEMVEAMGNDAPAEARERLKAMRKSGKEMVSSTERMKSMAKAEGFAVAWGGLSAKEGEPLDVSFTGYPAEAFDGTALVTT
jgi:ankyrin repeat protein